jgi:EpsI family protein
MIHPRRSFIVGAACLSAVGVAEAMRPRHRLADDLPPLALSDDFPVAFNDWREDPSVMPVLPDPTVQASLSRLYAQVLARGYRNATGELVMLTVAYGSDQGSETTAVHRPEFCYSAQGFKVRNAGVGHLVLPGRTLTVQRLLAEQGDRVEPILYWVTLANEATLPGWSRKWHQLRYGLRGEIPDGMLVRTSTVGLLPKRSFDLQMQFLGQLRAALPARVVGRVFGS